MEVRNGSSLDEAQDIMTASLNEVISKGVTDEEVSLSKQRILNIRKRESVNTGSLAVGLSNWIGTGDWRLYFLHRDRLEMVKPEEVQRVAAKYLVTSNRTLGYFIPSPKADLVTIPSTPYVKSLVMDYKGRPPVDTVPDFDYSHENIEARTTRMILSSGIKAALLPKPTCCFTKSSEVLYVSVTK